MKVLKFFLLRTNSSLGSPTSIQRNVRIAMRYSPTNSSLDLDMYAVLCVICFACFVCLMNLEAIFNEMHVAKGTVFQFPFMRSFPLECRRAVQISQKGVSLWSRSVPSILGKRLRNFEICNSDSITRRKTLHGCCLWNISSVWEKLLVYNAVPSIISSLVSIAIFFYPLLNRSGKCIMKIENVVFNSLRNRAICVKINENQSTPAVIKHSKSMIVIEVLAFHELLFSHIL